MDPTVPYPYAASLADAKSMAAQGINYPGPWAGWSDRMYAFREIRNNLMAAIVTNARSAIAGGPPQMTEQYEWEDGRILTAADFASVGAIQSWMPEIDPPITDTIDVAHLKEQARVTSEVYAAGGTGEDAQEAREKVSREIQRDREAAADAAAGQQVPVTTGTGYTPPDGGGGLSQGRVGDPDPSRRLPEVPGAVPFTGIQPILIAPLAPAPVSTTSAALPTAAVTRAAPAATTATPAAAAAAASASSSPWLLLALLAVALVAMGALSHESPGAA